MASIVRLALVRPYTFVVMSILILIFGVMSIFRTPTDIFPSIGIPVISVVWQYTGLPPDDMSGRIVSVFERVLTTTVNDIEHTESQSVPGYGIVKIYFQPNVDITAAQAQVTSISQTMLKQLPAGITPPLMLTYNASSVPIIQLALSSNTLSQSALQDLAVNFIRPQLTTVPGAQMPYPYGGVARQVQIDLDQSALHAHNLSASDVGAALARQNLITPVGTQKIGSYEWIVDLNDSPKTIEEFNNLPIKVVDGATVFIRDVAHVRNGSPPQTNVVQLDGKKGVLLSIMKIGNASTLDIIAGIKARLPAIQATLPPGVDMKYVADQSGFVKDSVVAVVREGIIAAALTGFMILVFLGSWRSTLIITVSIPLAVLCSLIALSALGQTINVMTLGGLALAVGILVDDATVTIENINRHMEEFGEDIVTAITLGAQEIMPPATVALFCICIAFVPLLALGGVAGFLFRPLAMAVVFAMIASYVLTYTVVPTLARYLLAHQAQHHAPGTDGAPQQLGVFGRFQQGFERRFERFRQAYLGLLGLALSRKYHFSFGFIGVVLLSFGLLPYLGTDFFPTTDAAALRIHLRAPTGTRIEETTALAGRVEARVRALIPTERVASIVNNIGLPISGINVSYSNSGTIGTFDADMLVTLHEGETSSAEITKTLRERLPRDFPGVTFSFLPPDIVSQILNFGSPAALDVQIAGGNAEANRAYAHQLLSRIRHVTGVADARIQEQSKGPGLRVDFNREFARVVGLTEGDAASSIQASLSGSTQTAPTYWLDPKNGVSYPVSVQTPQYSIDTLGELRNLPITAARSMQLLGGLANISPEPHSAVVTHYNVAPTVNILAATQDRDLGATASDVQTIIDETKDSLPKGATVSVRGQSATMASAYRQLLIGLAFSIVLIYLLIVVNFQSWLDPFVIIMALPAALAGIVWMLFITQTTVSVPALTGAIMCMGVATANSILVISFAREQLKAGYDAVQSALAAGATRLRPVVMTALAMMIGMAPMAIEPGQNAPLGRAVIGGLLFATAATLLFVPVVFSIVHGRAKRHADADMPSALPSPSV
ncbi:efflux RND transporter permease subunit [Methylobacterium gnaphalii]|uniref:RND transporter n=1 Tax=Methylobacterium gnaphalii TaxID=1010610 RepID=A0A512JLM2_9HYPH|nr:efflux RND transporter permease subunit [Methylobacterium gnaphalii]GEP10850.1 RND transporter [Methylobacterium gnaphalii]GJD70772.1 Multidrug resistance protein MdtC [Methylobacterium gnaphalii]GLS50704.1 RND transporter [Methylobacterium gnaphalii]